MFGNLAPVAALAGAAARLSGAKRLRSAGCADSERSSAAATGVRSITAGAPPPSVTSMPLSGASCHTRTAAKFCSANHK